ASDPKAHGDAKMKTAATLITAALAMAVATAASATIIFQVGNNPQPGEENILFNDNDGPALTIFGTTNQSGLSVSFTGTENLVTQGNGQAMLLAEDGAFSDLSIALTN